MRYSFYTDSFGGQLPEETFSRFVKRAEFFVSSIPGAMEDEGYEMAVCAVIDAINTNESGGQVASESVGSWHRSFAVNVEKSKSAEGRLYEAANMYLQGVKMGARWV